MEYLHWDEKTVTDASDTKEISSMYDRGYVFTRIGRGVMHQTRSIRIDLKKFELSSENRRILKKAAEANLTLSRKPLPLSESDYHWSIAKLGKDFYETKFGPGIFSAQKIKEALTDAAQSNFNELNIFNGENNSAAGTIGYAICFSTPNFVHYSYPFYDLSAPKDTGLGMMLLAITDAQSRGLDYIYLGSLQRPTDTYKLQFKGIEWFDGKEWQNDLEKAKIEITQK